MTLSVQNHETFTNKNPYEIRNFNCDLLYTFAKNLEIKESVISGSPVVTIDRNSQIFGDIVEWKRLPATPLPIEFREIKDLENVIEKLNALEAISGLFDELTSEQKETFESAILRRPLFE